MATIQPTFETSPAQKSTVKPIISSHTTRVSEKQSLEAQEEATMSSKTQHETVPLTSNTGEILLVSPSAAQAQQARSNIKRADKQYKHCQGIHKARSISGKGTTGSKGKPGKHKSAKVTKSTSKTKGKSAQGGKKSTKSGKKSSSGGKKKTSAKKGASNKKSSPKGKAKGHKGKSKKGK